MRSLAHADQASAALTAAVPQAARDMASMFGITKPGNEAKDRGNFFALAGRHTVLDQLEKDPIVATSKVRRGSPGSPWTDRS